MLGGGGTSCFPAPWSGGSPSVSPSFHLGTLACVLGPLLRARPAMAWTWELTSHICPSPGSPSPPSQRRPELTEDESVSLLCQALAGPSALLPGWGLVGAAQTRVWMLW